MPARHRPDRFSHLVREDERRKGIPIIRVPQFYGNFTAAPDSLQQQAELLLQQMRLNVFVQAGYHVERGGFPNKENPKELGMHARLHEFANNEQRYKAIAAETGATMPRTFDSIDDILASDIPLVAKKHGSHRGEDKYILRTKEDKIRFVAASLVGETKLQAILSIPNRAIREAFLDELVQAVREGNFSHPTFERDQNIGFTVQEYIKTPSERSTSFRIVADALGNIRSVLLLYSETSSPSPSSPSVFHQVFLAESPLQLESKLTVSNYAQGGGIIDLLHEGATDDIERAILQAHHIRSINNLQQLLALSSQIGIVSRFDFPFVGIDFMQDEQGNYHLIEVNLAPNIAAREVGLNPRQFGPGYKAELEIMRQVAVAYKNR